jgi:hypothetical protein
MRKTTNIETKRKIKNWKNPAPRERPQNDPSSGHRSDPIRRTKTHNENNTIKKLKIEIHISSFHKHQSFITTIPKRQTRPEPIEARTYLSLAFMSAPASTSSRTQST